MAEIGIVASVIGVASAGFRLSLILNAICCEVAQAPLEIHQISKTVTLFSLMLKQTGTVLQAVNSVHSQEAVEAAKQVADESNRVFDEINRMLDGVRNTNADGSSKTTAQQRIKWCFKRNRINYLLGQLESLKLSLSLMLQILQLGRLMASTSIHDPPEVVRDKSAAIQQERVEAQNTLIVRYMQITETQRMYETCETINSEPPSPIECKDSTDNDSNDSVVTVKLPSNTGVTLNLVRLPLYSLGEVDQILQHMCDSSKDMVRSSDQAIDPLLDRWTRWREARENRHARNPHGRYAPTVQNSQEDDLPYYEIYREREDSPRGYYLEGQTTDWRKPNSVVARQELIRRKKQYAGYQPCVTGHSSDQEDSPASNASSKRSTKRHVINSSSDSSDSEEISRRKPASKFQPGPPLDRKMAAPSSASSNKQTTSRTPPSPAPSTGTKAPTTPQQGQVNGNKQAITPQGQPNSGRPYPTPDQTMFHHSMSMPVPPVYTHNAPNPYAPNSPHSPLYNYPPYYGQLGGPSTRQHPPNPNRMSAPLRPISRDGKGGKSPSRLSQEMLRDSDWDRDWDRERERERERDRLYDRDRDRERDRDRGRDRDYARQERKSRESKNKALRDGATKGLLGAIGIAGFLEALEGLSI